MPRLVATPKIVPSTAAVSTAWPSGTVDPLAEDGVERGAHGERQVLAVGEVGERESHQGVHRPAGDAVVEQRPHGRVAGGVDRAGLTDRWRGVLRDRLDDGVEHHVGADAGGEEHAGPRERGELRTRVVGAEPDAAVARGAQEDHEADDRGGQGDVEPAEAGADPAPPPRRSRSPRWSGATIAHSVIAQTPDEGGDEDRPPHGGPRRTGVGVGGCARVELCGHAGLRARWVTWRCGGLRVGAAGSPSRCR